MGKTGKIRFLPRQSAAYQTGFKERNSSLRAAPSKTMQANPFCVLRSPVIGWRMQKIDGNLNSQSARAVMGMLFILPALAFICWHSMGVLVGRMSLKFGLIERNRNPYQFWYLVISGYVVLLATVVFGLLVCVGIWGHFD